MPLLPSTPGAIRYGTFTFGAETETTGLSVVPQYDEARRTVIYNKYQFTIETVLAGAPQDAAVRAIVQQLTKPAFPFTYTGRGIGVTVNIGRARDVVWGPTPLSCDVKPLGGGNAVKLTWKVEVHIPDCADAVYQFAMMEFNYSINYSIDATGYTTRTHSGFVRIPQTRVTPGARGLIDSADAYREAINPRLPFGFRRIPGQFTLSMDKCRLDFSIVDEQLPPNILPPGIIEATAEHTVSSPPMKWMNWDCTLSATYELARGDGATIAAARDAFFRLLRDRVTTTTAAAAVKYPGDLPGGDAPGREPSVVVPVSFSFSEPEIYGHTKAKFVATYMVKGAGITKMLAHSGAWRPTPDGRWFAWTASIPTATGPRGHARLVFDLKDDRIVDLCRETDFKMGDAADSGGPIKGDPVLPVPAGAIPGGIADIPAGVFPVPTPEKSWLHWESSTAISVDSGIVPLMTLPSAPIREVNDLLGGSWGATAAAHDRRWQGAALPKTDAFLLANTSQVPPENRPGGDYQRRKQSCYLYFRGRAARVRFGIPCPVLQTWGNVKLVPANRHDKGEGFAGGIVGNVGWPVYGASWNLRYWVPEIPSNVDLPVSGVSVL